MTHIPRHTALTGWAYYAFELLCLPGLLLTAGAKLGIGEAEVNFVYYFLNFVCVFWIFREYLSLSLEKAAENTPALLRTVALGAVTLWAANALMGLLTRYAPEFANANDSAIAAMVAEHPILMGVGTVLLVPLAEECLFRGLIFSQLRPERRGAAYCASTAAFCAVHVVGFVGAYPPVWLAMCFVQYIPAGLILAWAHDHSGTIIAPVLIHTAINAIAYLGVV